MKFFTMLISLIAVSLSSYALKGYNDVRSFEGMLATSSIASKDSVGTAKAEMECSLYRYNIEGDRLGESTKLVSQKTQPFTVGIGMFWGVNFPEPYQNISVRFNHFMTGYRESGNNSLPYVQAVFKKDGKLLPDVRDVSFDLGNAQTGSKVLLRGHHNFNSTTLLTYQCSLNYL